MAGTGAVLSAVMVTSCICVTVLPAASVYVHVMVVSDVMGKTSAGKLCVAMTSPEQLSIAVGRSRLRSASSDRHSLVSLDKVMKRAAGTSLSVMVTCCVCVAVLPDTSVYVHVMALPDMIGKALLGTSCVTKTAPGQLSAGAAGAAAFTAFSVTSHRSIMASRTPVTVGGAVSTITCCVCTILSFLWVYFHVILVFSLMGKVTSKAASTVVPVPAQPVLAVGGVREVTSHCELTTSGKVVLSVRSAFIISLGIC